jgi:hypothetical protein
MSTAWQQSIRESRQEILDRWTGMALSLFSASLGPSSPLSEAIAEGFGMILDNIEEDGDMLAEALTRTTRILAVQNLPPSRAMSIFLSLYALAGGFYPSGREAFRDRLETLTLQAFDSYMKHRETIYQLKVEETARRMHMALRRAEA